MEKLSDLSSKRLAAQASGLFKFPLEDHSGGPGAEGALYCRDKNEFLQKFDSIVGETNLDVPFRNDELRFHWPDHYTFRQGGRDFTIVRVDKNWKVAYFPYHE